MEVFCYTELMATIVKLKNNSAAKTTRIVLAIIAGIIGFCIILALYILDGLGTHFRAGGTLGGYGESATAHIDSSVQMTHSEQYYWVLAIVVAIFASIIMYSLVSLIQSKFASRKAH
jgi:hypothetical protein